MQSVKATMRTSTEWYEAVGTVRPRTETRIEAQVPAQVKSVNVKPGDKVKRNQILISLDSRQFTSRLDQARQGAVAAQAAFTRAEAAYNRTRLYFESQAATAQDLERVEEGLTSARAGIRRAQEVVKEAQIALGYTTIRAPGAGRVLKRLVEPGDLAAPGKPLLMLETSGMFRLEAYVREGLIKKVRPQTVLKVSIGALDEFTDATVEEIVPYADPATRTFLVKVSLPRLNGLYPGMFGKLLVPVREHQVVVVPRAAVRRIGQLELVSVKENDTWTTRYVKTGKSMEDEMEILSGLSGGEIVGY
jgi:RND family efflux transporter MFP subunit